MLQLLFKVIFIYMLGPALLFLVAWPADLVLGTDLVEFLTGRWQGFTLCSLAGVLMLAWAIRDGQFVGDVKPTHWSMTKQE